MSDNRKKIRNSGMLLIAAQVIRSNIGYRIILSLLNILPATSMAGSILFEAMNKIETDQFKEFARDQYKNQIRQSGIDASDSEIDQEFSLIDDSNNYFYKIVNTDTHVYIGKIWWSTDTDTSDGLLCARIEFIWVEPEHRSQGYGKLILEYLESYYLSTVKHIDLHVFSFNKPAIKLYKKLGYNIYQTFQHCFADSYFMRKTN